VHDALGREVATLADNTMEPGVYQFPFNAVAFNSGVYHCTLRAGTSYATIQMHLVK
jgi:hypothetical protein